MVISTEIWKGCNKIKLHFHLLLLGLVAQYQYSLYTSIIENVFLLSIYVVIVLTAWKLYRCPLLPKHHQRAWEYGRIKASIPSRIGCFQKVKRFECTEDMADRCCSRFLSIACTSKPNLSMNKNYFFHTVKPRISPNLKNRF